MLSVLGFCFGACGETDVPVTDTDAVQETVAPAQVDYRCEPQFDGLYEQPASHGCHLFTQGCELPDEACYLGDTKAECLKIGPSACGGQCEFANDCPEGGVCVGEPGFCYAVCGMGSDCFEATTCRAIEKIEGLGYCPLPCSVLDQDCPYPLACYLINGRQECALPEAPSMHEGQACHSGNRCKPGLICQETDKGRCRQPCSVNGDDAPCTTGQCVGLVGLEPLGVCLENP